MPLIGQTVDTNAQTLISNRKGTREYYLKRYTHLRGQREGKMKHWKDLSDFVLPRAGRFQESSGYVEEHKENDFEILNNTATTALDMLKSLLMHSITNPSIPWLKFKVKEDFGDNQDLKIWLEALDREFFSVLRASNFYSVIPALFEEISLFGISAMEVIPHPEKLIFFKPMTIGQYCCAADVTNELDTVFFENLMSVEQIYEEFVYPMEDPKKAEGKLSEDVKEAMKQGRLDERFKIIRGCFKNDDSEEMKSRSKRNEGRGHLPYKSVAFQEGLKPDMEQGAEGILKTGYYENFPILVPRWHVAPDDVYGYSPGSAAIGDVKTLQSLQRASLEITEKLADPPIVSETQPLEGQINRNAGEITYLGGTGSGTDMVKPLVQMQRVSAELTNDIVRYEERINKTFYSHLTNSIEALRAPDGTPGAGRQVTATEIQVRNQEKILQLSPVLDRFDYDFVDPLATIIIQMIIDSGRIDPPPVPIDSLKIDIEYLNSVAAAQRNYAIRSTLDYITLSAELAGHPNYRWLGEGLRVSQTAVKICSAMDIDTDLRLTAEEIEAKIEAEREAVAKQQEQQMMLEMAKAAKPGAEAAEIASKLPEE